MKKKSSKETVAWCFCAEIHDLFKQEIKHKLTRLQCRKEISRRLEYAKPHTLKYFQFNWILIKATICTGTLYSMKTESMLIYCRYMYWRWPVTTAGILSLTPSWMKIRLDGKEQSTNESLTWLPCDSKLFFLVWK
jgi:hypothetical protein